MSRANQAHTNKRLQNTEMIEIIQATSEEEIEMADQLNWEYLSWCVDESQDRLGEELDINELYSHSKIDQESFLADTGRLLLAKENEVIGGMACLKKIRENTCEIKGCMFSQRFEERELVSNCFPG